MSKRKTRFISTSEESDASVSQFHSSVSYFRETEEKALKINVHPTMNFDEILKHDKSEIRTSTGLELAEFDEGKIVVFSPDKHPHLNTSQVKFLNKLRLVMVNNDTASEESNFEKFIDDLVLFLYDCLGFDDGKNITMR